MAYNFANTYRQNFDTYIEDRGYPVTIRRGDPNFDALDAEFANLIKCGQTAIHSQDGEGWDVVDGFPLLDGLKADKYAQVKHLFDRVSSNAVATSSLGFDVDADETAQRRISGIISDMSARDIGNVSFCDAANKFHVLTLEQVKTLQIEVIEHEQSLLQKKWALRTAINDAASVEDLQAVKISF